jgi:hypothetical protein
MDTAATLKNEFVAKWTWHIPPFLATDFEGDLYALFDRIDSVWYGPDDSTGGPTRAIEVE